MNFDGHTVLITGGTGDLGQALVRRLHTENLQVAFTFHTQTEAAERLAQDLGTQRVLPLPLPELSLASARKVVEQVKQHWGPLDFMVNAIGQLHDRSLVQMNEEEWHESLRTNLDSVFVFCRAAVFDLIKKPGRAVVNIASIAGLTGAKGQCNYAAAKAGVIGFSLSLAREIGRLGIRVNVVAPGYVRSRMTETLPPAVTQQALGLIPAHRFGEPEEIASAVAFLLSTEAAYIHGQVLAVDGGLVM